MRREGGEGECHAGWKEIFILIALIPLPQKTVYIGVCLCVCVWVCRERKKK